MVTGSLAHWGHWGPPKVDLTWLSKKKENKDESGRLSGGLGFLGNMRNPPVSFWAPPGSSWLLLAPPGSPWLLLAPPGSPGLLAYFWLLLDPPGSYGSYGS